PLVVAAASFFSTLFAAWPVAGACGADGLATASVVSSFFSEETGAAVVASVALVTGVGATGVCSALAPLVAVFGVVESAAFTVGTTCSASAFGTLLASVAVGVSAGDFTSGAVSCLAGSVLRSAGAAAGCFSCFSCAALSFCLGCSAALEGSALATGDSCCALGAGAASAFCVVLSAATGAATEASGLVRTRKGRWS